MILLRCVKQSSVDQPKRSPMSMSSSSAAGGGGGGASLAFSWGLPAALVSAAGVEAGAEEADPPPTPPKNSVTFLPLSALATAETRPALAATPAALRTAVRESALTSAPDPWRTKAAQLMASWSLSVWDSFSTGTEAMIKYQLLKYQIIEYNEASSHHNCYIIPQVLQIPRFRQLICFLQKTKSVYFPVRANHCLINRQDSDDPAPLLLKSLESSILIIIKQANQYKSKYIDSQRLLLQLQRISARISLGCHLGFSRLLALEVEVSCIYRDGCRQWSRVYLQLILQLRSYGLWGHVQCFVLLQLQFVLLHQSLNCIPCIFSLYTHNHTCNSSKQSWYLRSAILLAKRWHISSMESRLTPSQRLIDLAHQQMYLSHLICRQSRLFREGGTLLMLVSSASLARPCLQGQQSRSCSGWQEG